jgi:uncharacterized protein YoxC
MMVRTSTIAQDVDIKVAKLETTVESVQEDVKELKDEVKVVHGRITEGNEKIMDKLIDIQRDATNQHDGIVARMNDMDKRINGRIGMLEKWKWMVLGGAILAGWVISAIPTILKLMQ